MAEFLQLNPETTTRGLGVVTGAIFLSGEMAGSGVLALPNALLGTGWSGMILIAFFSINAAYIGTRLGLCWEILTELGFEEFAQNHVSDPYPLIAEKTGSLKGYWTGRILRYLTISKYINVVYIHQAYILLYSMTSIITTVCIVLTLYGAPCVFMILIADFIHDLSDQHLSKCLWIVVVACTICPFTWFGTPKDFW